MRLNTFKVTTLEIEIYIMNECKKDLIFKQVEEKGYNASIVSLLRIKLNNLNNTGARKLDYINHRTLQLFKKISFFA